MKMPNFLIIGAAKAGTTSLYYYLNQHPEIYMSSFKEPRFFALEGEKLNFQNPDGDINYTSVTSLEAYYKLFEDVTNEIAIGEASPLYLYSSKATERIKYYIPNANLIAILRDPVQRAFSCYTHLVRENHEKLLFEQAICEEKHRIQNNWAHLWHYKNGGYYYQQLKRYFDTFNREQIKVFLYEELNANSIDVVQDIFRFLEVDDTFIPDLTRMNVSGVPKSRILHSLLSTKNPVRNFVKPLLPKKFRENVSRSIQKWNLERKLTLALETRKELIDLYREDILQLQDLIQKDLSKWLQP
jgi:hypothetical protein